jgi:DNA-binding MarR family transcriptional regulator
MLSDDSDRGAGSMVLLTRLAKLVYRRSTEELLGMRLRHFVTLSYLRDRQQAPQAQMCEMLGIDANNLVLLLNSLEVAGHLQRRRDPADRRRHLVELTAAGRRALERAERAQESIEEEVLATLSAEERATLHELLSRALAGPAQRSADGPAPTPTGAMAVTPA